MELLYRGLHLRIYIFLFQKSLLKEHGNTMHLHFLVTKNPPYHKWYVKLRT